jgi:hypothetical protein
VTSSCGRADTGSAERTGIGRSCIGLTEEQRLRHNGFQGTGELLSEFRWVTLCLLPSVLVASATQAAVA